MQCQVGELELIADFLGVLHERELRNARELTDTLTALSAPALALPPPMPPQHYHYYQQPLGLPLANFHPPAQHFFYPPPPPPPPPP